MGVVNWADTGKFEVYPAGTYLVRIDSWKQEEAKTGTLRVRWSAEILNAPKDSMDDVSKHIGKTITGTLSLHDNSLWRVPVFVNSCGIDLSKVKPSEVMSPIFQRILNACKDRTIYWQIEKEIGNDGNDRNSISAFVKDSEQDVRVLEEDGSFLPF